MKKLLFASAFAAGITWIAVASAATLEPPATSPTPATPNPPTPAKPATAAKPAATVKPVKPIKPSRYRTVGMAESAKQYYRMTWGVDQLSAKLAESGQLVRFNYRVVDAAKAAPLNNRASAPQLLDEKAHVVLQVPTMEKVGPLRQSMTPENGKTYWMVFSNKGNYVKPGQRVSVVIGQVRIDGLIVQNF